MPIPLGILAAAGFRPSAAGSYDLLETTVLTGNQAAVEFTNLATKYAATYQHLQIRVVARSSYNGALAGLIGKFNGDTGNNYANHALYGTGSTVGVFANSNTGQVYVGSAAGATSAANSFSADVIDILDPFETTKNTTTRTLTGYATNDIGLHSGVWFNTAAITTIRLTTDVTSNLVAGSRFSLYGLKAA